jgi:hypothetical protein
LSLAGRRLKIAFCRWRHVDWIGARIKSFLSFLLWQCHESSPALPPVADGNGKLLFTFADLIGDLIGERVQLATVFLATYVPFPAEIRHARPHMYRLRVVLTHLNSKA